jgi:hypothetical protein
VSIVLSRMTKDIHQNYSFIFHVQQHLVVSKIKHCSHVTQTIRFRSNKSIQMDTRSLLLAHREQALMLEGRKRPSTTRTSLSSFPLPPPTEVTSPNINASISQSHVFLFAVSLY